MNPNQNIVGNATTAVGNMPLAENDASVPQNDNGTLKSAPINSGQINRQPQLNVQPQPLIDPQMPIPPQAPIVSGTGDILLTPEKKSRKGLIIGVVIALFLILGCVAIIFIIEKVSVRIISDELRDSFYSYANYVLYGKDSLTPIDEDYKLNKDYYINQELQDEDQMREFFLSAKALNAAFRNQFTELSHSDNNQDNSQIEELYRLASKQDEIYGVLAMLSTKARMTYSNVFNEYREDGGEKTVSTIEGYYDVDDVNELAKSVNQDFENAWLSKVKLWDIYSSVGCLDSLVENKICFDYKATEAQREEAERLNAEYLEWYASFNSSYTLVHEYIYTLFEINDLIGDIK